MVEDIYYRLENLLSNHKHQGYNTNYFKDIGLPSFFVGESVLRPEMSYVSKYLTKWLSENKIHYINKNVLEIGCGSGIQSITICLNGAKRILATDISEFALESTARNKILYGLNGNFIIRKGYLFDPIDPNEKFDFALFNHPFFDGKPNKHFVFETSILDDRELAGIFLENIWDYLSPGGVAIMPYSYICGERNDPIKFSNALGLNYKIAFHKEDKDGFHRIFIFSKF